MTSVVTTAASSTLEPVRRALLDDAHADADRTRRAARDAADEVVRHAEAEVAAAVDQARHRARVAAAARAEQELARARGAAHTSLLETELALRRAWEDRVHERLHEIRGDDRYPALLDRLEELVRHQLGEDATIERDVEPDGGVVGTVGGRRVDHRLGALADRAIEMVVEEATASWT